MAKTVGLALCLVLAFVAGIQNQHPGRLDVAPMSNAFLVDAAHWPVGVEAQKNAVMSAGKQANYLADQLYEVASVRTAAADVVRRYALNEIKLEAVRCIQHLGASKEAGRPEALLLLERVEAALAETR